MMDNTLKVGFIGLGLMGNPMAKNICSKGFPLFVFNRSKNKTQEFEKLGCTITNYPSELALTADIIITVVTGPKDVKEVIFGKNGITRSLKDRGKKSLTIIDMSTIGVQAAKEIAKALEKHDIDFLDAPVTGGVMGATNGKLTIFVGGKKEVFEKAKPVLEAMGTNIHYMGPTGTGQAIKLVNNLLVGETITVLSESMILADKLGLPRKQVADILSEVPAVSLFMKMRMPNLVSQKHPVSFSVANLKKDLGLALEEVKKDKKKLPLLNTTFKLYKKSVQKGYSDEDISAVVKALEDHIKS